MVTDRELQVFGPRYLDIKNRLGFNWFYTEYSVVYKPRNIKVNLKRFKGSLLDLIILLENYYLKDYKELDIYENIDTIGNNYEFSDKENYYLLSCGAVIKSQYHKYYRAYDIGYMKVPDNCRWDGKYNNELIKRISKKLVKKVKGGA